LVGCGGRKGCLGAVKSHVSKEWFLQQYEDKSLTKMVVVLLPCTIENINNTKARIIIYTGNAFLYQKRKS
jgi:hypothetical protein